MISINLEICDKIELTDEVVERERLQQPQRRQRHDAPTRPLQQQPRLLDEAAGAVRDADEREAVGAAHDADEGERQRERQSGDDAAVAAVVAARMPPDGKPPPSPAS